MLPAKVYVEPTTRCNLACAMCVRASWSEPVGDMDGATFDCVIGLAVAARGAIAISFAGVGEPLLHPLIVEMVERAAQTGARTELTTNGTLLDRATAEALLRAGLSRLWVSLDSGPTGDGACSPTVGHAENDRVRENVTAFAALRRGHSVELGLAHVVSRANRDGLDVFLGFARKLSVDLVHLSHLIPYTAGQNSESLVPAWYARRSAEPALPWIGEARLAADRFIPVSLAPERGRCPFIDAEAVAVAWDGRVAPCPPLLRSHETHQPGMARVAGAYVVGRLCDRSLADLWRDREHQDFRARMKGGVFAPCGWCGACSLSLDNQADCYGIPFPACGGCPWLQGTVRCP
ncbi:MAG: radical SAM protein [Thermotogota bacterium]